MKLVAALTFLAATLYEAMYWFSPELDHITNDREFTRACFTTLAWMALWGTLACAFFLAWREDRSNAKASMRRGAYRR